MLNVLEYAGYVIAALMFAAMLAACTHVDRNTVTFQAIAERAP